MQIESLIAKHPCFSTFNTTDIKKLAALAIEKKYSENEIIASQNEELDAIYIILQGAVEVANRVKKAGFITLMPECILREGDAIGLNTTGLFALESVHPVTLTAITDVTLVGWPIKIFLNFLQTHPNANTSLKRSAELMLRVDFIKKINPFSDLSTAEIAKIAKDIQEMEVSAGTILFHEGEPGEQCYLIQSGEVQILIANPDGSQRTAAVLQAPTLFGEIAILSDTPRNATAKMLTSGKLLVLTKEQLHALMESHNITEDYITSLAVERGRPTRSPDVIYFHRTTADGQHLTILKNTKLRRYYQLSAMGWFIWQQMDGTQTIEEITIKVFKQYKIFSPEVIAETIFELIEAGFVNFPAFFPPASPIIPQENDTLSVKIKKWLHKIVFIRFIFNDIDKIITTSYQRGVKFLFTKSSQAIIAAFIVVGLIIFFAQASTAITFLSSLSYPFIVLILLILASYILVMFHELAHAYTVKAMGHDVHRAGVVFYWVGLFAFVDTSDMWLSQKWPRVAVNLAGPYADLILAGVASILACLINQAETKEFFWLLALFLYISVLINLNPLREGDGYHALSNVLNAPKLRISAFSLLKNLKFIHKQKPELIYWLICLAFLAINLLLAFTAQYYLSALLPQHFYNIPLHYVLWLLPVIVIIRFIIKIYFGLREIKQKSP